MIWLIKKKPNMSQKLKIYHIYAKNISKKREYIYLNLIWPSEKRHGRSPLALRKSPFYSLSAHKNLDLIYKKLKVEII